MNQLVAFICLLGVSCMLPSVGISEDENDHGHDHGHAHGEGDAGYEIGFSIGSVHLVEEDQDELGLHVHISKRLGHEGLWGQLSLGVGAEFILGDHEHQALMLPLSYAPWRGLILGIAPSIEWAEHEGERESAYATHAEVAYVFEIGKYDIGPVVDYSKTSDEEHYMIGIHFGFHL